jgi:sugar lactone lactonase YvrE
MMMKQPKRCKPRHLLWGCLLFLSPGATSHALDFAGSPGSYPHGLATDGTNLWHADYEASRIYILDDQAQVESSFAFPYARPRGLTHASGVLYVASGSRVYRLNPADGSHLSDFASPDPSAPNHQGLALGDGTLWIASRGSPDWIYGVDPLTGAAIVDFAAPGSNPRGLTFHDASLWNLDSSDNRLYRLSPVDGTILASYPIPLGNPRGLTFLDGLFLQADMQVDLIMGFGITNGFSDLYIAPLRYPAGSLQLPYISSHPRDEPNAAIRRILFCQHGISDNAVTYFARARYAADLAGCLEETLVVSFQLLDDDKFTSAPPANLLYWTGSRFWGGLSASSTAPYPRAERFSAFTLLDNFLSGMTADPALFPNLEEIVISGHSGGGQFVNRYAATSPFERTMLPPGRAIALHYVCMNPSSYVYFDGKRLDPATLDLAAGVVDFVVPAAPPNAYNNYGYGLENLYDYPTAVGSAAITAQYPGRKVIYLAGEADTGSASLDIGAAAMLQGSNRYERCLVYYAHLQDHFGPASLLRHRLGTVPGVGHDGLGMITSEVGLRYLFQGPLRLSGLSQAGGAATISWTGGDGLATIQRSTNLLDWTTILATNAPSPFVDTASPPLLPGAFYRLAEPPGP